MTRTPLLFSGLLVAACATHSTAPAANHGGGDPSLPREYAARFAPARQWSFTTDHTVDDGEGTPEKTSGTASCRVVNAVRAAAGRESQIECTRLGDDQGYDPVSGVWLANDQGLWFLGLGE